MERMLKNYWKVLLVTTLLSGCGKEVQLGERVVPVRVVVAAEKSVPFYLDALGTCTACDSVDVRAQVGGRILAEHFEQGHVVEKGQLLYSIDPRIFQAQVMAARGQVRQAEAQLSVDQLRLDRSRALLEEQYISRQDYDTLVALVDQDLGRLEAAKGEFLRAETSLDFCSVRTPVGGLAGCKMTNVGNVIDGGTVLVRVQSLSPLYVDFSVSENDFPRLYDHFSKRQSLDCLVQLLSDTSKTVPARLEIVNNQVTPQTGSVKLRAVLNNPNGEFWPGESVRIRVILAQLEHAVLAPEVAVGTSAQGQYVFVVGENGTAQVRPVLTGQSHGEDVVYVKGLQVGDRVIVEGQFLLAPGTRVAQVNVSDAAVTKAGGATESTAKGAEIRSTTGNSH
ncbi:MAG: efflux RND transporter periplasmic adaptor subunit [Puniceicoccales bacterium]|nr:efflux RND transporter periplasmic adaptor subunit [Puniceicoccales bacterium]